MVQIQSANTEPLVDLASTEKLSSLAGAEKLDSKLREGKVQKDFLLEDPP